MLFRSLSYQGQVFGDTGWDIFYLSGDTGVPSRLRRKRDGELLQSERGGGGNINSEFPDIFPWVQEYAAIYAGADKEKEGI